MNSTTPGIPPHVGSVVFFTHSLPRFVADFGAVTWQLSALGIKCSVYGPPAHEGPEVGWRSLETIKAYAERLPPRTEHGALPIQRDRPAIRSAVRTMAMAWRLGRACSNGIFVCWAIVAILLCGLPLRLLARRCVFLLTGMGSIFGSDRLRHRIARTVVRPMYRFAFSGSRSRVIVHNSEDRQYLVDSLGVAPEHVTLTPGCGVDPDEFPYCEEFARNPRKVILVPVRLLREKGVLDAAAASEELARRGVDHEMWFSSAPDEGHPSGLGRRDIDAIAGRNPHVRFIGYQQSLVPCYQSCDIVCVPTKYREGLPTALLEAAASGRPIVTCDNIGGREFITDSETGLIVPPGAPIALADALERLIVDRRLADRLRRNAFQHFESGFTKDVMVTRTLDVFRDLGLAVPIEVSSGARAVERIA